LVAEPARQLDRQANRRHRATNGVGLGTTRALAQAGAHVILAVRNTELGEQRAAQVGGSTSVVKLDLADLASVRAFPSLVEGDIDILINNAGTIADRRTDTVDGFEMTLGTNLLGPFALTNLLLPRVRSRSSTSAPTRTARRSCGSTTCTCATTSGRDLAPMRCRSWQ